MSVLARRVHKPRKQANTYRGRCCLRPLDDTMQC